MRGIDSFILSYAALSLSSVSLLAIMGVETVEIYVTVLAIEFFVASELYPTPSLALSRRKTIIGVMMLAAFAVIVIVRIVEILRLNS
jgi:hypothetical protein